MYERQSISIPHFFSRLFVWNFLLGGCSVPRNVCNSLLLWSSNTFPNCRLVIINLNLSFQVNKLLVAADPLWIVLCQAVWCDHIVISHFIILFHSHLSECSINSAARTVLCCRESNIHLHAHNMFLVIWLFQSRQIYWWNPTFHIWCNERVFITSNNRFFNLSLQFSSRQSL